MITVQPDVLSRELLSNSFLGVPVEICLATRSLEKTMEAMTSLGIGPWGLYRFDGETVVDRRSYGKPDDFIIRVAFATNGPIIWELMEPVQGAEVLTNALRDHDTILHHVAFDGARSGLEERRAELDRRGAKHALSGVWLGRVPFYFFEAPGLDGVVLESYFFPPDFIPEPDSWYPAAPPS